MASEKTITITTNRSDWTAISNVDWIELTQSENTLTVKVLANPLTKERKGEIMVVAGIGRKILVTQKASDISIVSIPDKLDIDQWGGKYQFDIVANVQDWVISTDVDWVKITPKNHKNEVLVEVSENKSREARKARLLLSGADKKAPKEIFIEQSGAMHYILPLLDLNATEADVKAFELGRKSNIKIDMGYISGGSITWETASPIFPIVQYGFYQKSLDYIYMDVSNNDIYNDPEFLKMLESNNFVKVSDSEYEKEANKGDKVYIINAKFMQGDSGKIIFSIVPKQPAPLPTFDKLPYGLTDFNNATLDDVKKYEKEHNGTMNDGLCVINDPKMSENYYFFDVKNMPDTKGRAYFLYKRNGKLSETAQYFTKQSLVFYEAEGFTLVTAEFKALCKKEGFFYVGYSGGWHQFRNNEKKLGIAIRWVTLQDLGPVIDLHLFSTVAPSSKKYEEKQYTTHRYR
ncbi:BACON domain-containing protein [Porphyromonas macacae]